MKLKIIIDEPTPKVDSTISYVDYELIEKFLKFVRLKKNCAGLAANQVSVNGVRIMKPFFAIKNNHFWEIMIRPHIVSYFGGGELKIEQCLTWPGKRISVKRYYSIDVRYFNLKGKYISTTINGRYAQIFQHEYDHLMGEKEYFIKKVNIK